VDANFLNKSRKRTFFEAAGWNQSSLALLEQRLSYGFIAFSLLKPAFSGILKTAKSPR
jgi:hypothetical protein